MLANDPLPICCGRPETAITVIVPSGRLCRIGDISIKKV